ncbi:ethylbenzene dehydrogenase-related protein [Methylococcus sp. ANG]|uniref:ethylbenzene dehydrogenase-related protein n=1 Tax=Methylococcus sp. ANG TaxID=3231903 RepID=UPI003459B514
MQVPYGSRADVRTTARYEEGRGWSVTFRRKLDTGDPAHDVVFAKGGTYAFQVTTFDNGGGKEDLSHTTQDSGKVFTMGIPMEAGDLVFSEKPARLSELRGKLLASDEIEITASWTDPTRNDRRGEWTYGSGGWVKSTENEDRIAFLWDMQNDDFVSAGTCASMCHGNLHATAPGTKVDNWHWKASRSHPIGYADEQWWYDGVAHNGNGRRDDPGVGTAVENVLENGHPKYMAVGGQNSSARFLYLDAPQANGWSRAVAFGTGSPGILIRSITKSKLKVKKPGKGALDVSGTYNDGGNGLDLQNVELRIELGGKNLVLVPAGSFKSVAKGKRFTYTSQASRVKVVFNTVTKSFVISARKQDFIGWLTPVDLRMELGSLWGTASIN